jgi:uncharacterized membrane protein
MAKQNKNVRTKSPASNTAPQAEKAPTITVDGQPLQPKQAAQIIAKYHSGPLPAPEIMRAYDDLVPGAASDILTMAKIQAAHRQRLEADGQASDSAARSRTIEVENGRIQGAYISERIGLGLGALIAAACVGGANYAMVEDKGPVIVGFFLSLPVATIVRAFLKSPTKKDS